jgi:hypothetical protein
MASPSTATPVRVIAVLLFILGSVVVIEANKAFRMPQVAPEEILLRPSPGAVPAGD